MKLRSLANKKKGLLIDLVDGSFSSGDESSIISITSTLSFEVEEIDDDDDDDDYVEEYYRVDIKKGEEYKKPKKKTTRKYRFFDDMKDSFREEQINEIVNAHKNNECMIVSIDPGTKHLGVCVYKAFSNMVERLCEFDLDLYIPLKDDAIHGPSCFSKKKVVSGNIGACIINMIEENPDIFLPTYFIRKQNGNISPVEKEEDKSRLIIVIEKQMNTNPNNCCILSSFQSYYLGKQIECVILDPKKLNEMFPDIFIGTVGSRTERKKRINLYGYKLLTLRERNKSPIFDASKRNGKCKTNMKPSLHALDAMFYAFAFCCIDKDIIRNPVEIRCKRSSSLRYELRMLATKFAIKTIEAASEGHSRKRSEKSTKKRKRSKNKPNVVNAKKGFWNKKYYALTKKKKRGK